MDLRQENKELRDILNRVVYEHPNGEIRTTYREGFNLALKVPEVRKYIITHRQRRVEKLKAELAALEAELAEVEAGE